MINENRQHMNETRFLGDNLCKGVMNTQKASFV